MARNSTPRENPQKVTRVPGYPANKRISRHFPCSYEWAVTAYSFSLELSKLDSTLAVTDAAQVTVLGPGPETAPDLLAGSVCVCEVGLAML
eukprot:3329502-Rhodomonas_salina.1